MRKEFTSYFYLIMAMFLAGSSVVVGKLIVNTFPVFLSQTITLTIAVIFILPFAFLIEGNIFKIRISKKDIFYMFMQALTGMFLFRIFLLYGLKFTSAMESGIITSTNPAVLALLSLLLLKQRMDAKSWVGIAFCVLGIAIINIAKVGDMTYSTNIISGNILVMLAVVGESLFTIFRKKMSFTDKPITSTMIVITFSLIMFIPMSFFELKSFKIDSVTYASMIPLFIYGIFCTAIAYICWFRGIAKVSVTTAAGFTGVMPISSVILSCVVLGEIITWQHVLGTIMVIAGIYVISFSKVKKLVRVN